MIAAVHDLSGGRLVLRAGAGWSVSEFAAAGQDFAARAATTGQYLQLITRAWSQERVTSRDLGHEEGLVAGPRLPPPRHAGRGLSSLSANAAHRAAHAATERLRTRLNEHKGNATESAGRADWLGDCQRNRSLSVIDVASTS
jgi:alkanesulfonate monooxygenase SsuD/methylene tetrahydromethanopterin reductase-like flavin-dependent oxidoreductase (luciferase family)